MSIQSKVVKHMMFGPERETVMTIQHLRNKILTGLLVLVLAGCTAPAAQPAADETSSATTAPTTAPQSGLEGIAAVAIFIVDDYGQLTFQNYLTALSEQKITDADNCLLTPAGQTFAARGAALDANGRAHGAVVLEKAQEYLSERIGAEVNSSVILSGRELTVGLLPQSVLTEEGERTAIIIVPVQLPGFVTTGIADSLDTARQELDSAISNGDLYATDGEVTYQVDELAGIVLNLSFAIVPCDPSTVISELPSLQEFATLSDGEKLPTSAVTDILDNYDRSLMKAFSPVEIPYEMLPTVDGLTFSVPDLSPLDLYSYPEVAAAMPLIKKPAVLADFLSAPKEDIPRCMGRSISEYLAQVEMEFQKFRDVLSDAGNPAFFDAGLPDAADASLGMLSKTQLLAAYALGPTISLKDDSFEAYISAALSNDNDIPLIQVAAAGNMGCNYPFAPALWEGVVSVGANSGESYEFNKGEIIPDYDIREGTSLAAPMISVEEAIYLAATRRANCNGMAPPLNDDVWDNTPLANAALKCPDFAR